MNMGKGRHSRMTYKSDLLAAVEPLAALDHDTALSQMAVLGLPAIRMANNDPVTAEEISFGALKFGTRHSVNHAIAKGCNHAWRGGKNRHSSPHSAQVTDCNICSFVTIVAMVRAAKIANTCMWIMINKIDQPTISPGRTVDRQAEGGRLGARPRTDHH